MQVFSRYISRFFLFYLCSVHVTFADPANKGQLQIQLASVYRLDIDVQEYWVSEKLDGIRARWDGTQLLSRAGNIIHAPAWFIEGFPSEPLDGELWLARQRFEQTASIVLRDTPGDEWQNIRFMLFDLPEYKANFTQRLTQIQHLVMQTNSPYLQSIPHFRISSKLELVDKLNELVAQGAEGLMLHHQDAHYQDGRSSSLMKLKKYQDAEARVIAHLPGKGKYHYMMGALLVELGSGLQFKIGTGFSDIQRQNPPPIGSYVTFKHYGFTARGVPRFASFLRIKSGD